MEPQVVLIRRESPGDADAVDDVVRQAFGGSPEPIEVELVSQLRRSTAWLPRLAVVAVVSDAVVGHVVCTRAVLDPGGHAVLGLGPLAVTPQYQRRGVGTALMHSVLGAADACDETLVGLLGEPAYYRRFAFVPASQTGIEAPDRSWGAYFQVRRLSRWTPALRGRFRYATPFEGL